MRFRSPTLVLVGAVVLATIGPSGGRSETSAGSVRNGAILYARLIGSDPTGDIFRIPGNGGVTRPVIRSRFDDRDPRPSPTGRRVAFLRERESVWVARLDGTVVRRVSAGFVGPASWSPDGTKFVIWTPGGLAISRADGSRVWRLTADHADRKPAWSPDGRRIAFLRASSESTESLYVIDADGSNLRRLIDDAYEPMWSPDGTRIVFARHSESANVADLHVVEVIGVRVVRITNNLVTTAYSWGPDGKTILFVAAVRNPPGGFDMGQICVIRPDGSGLRRLTPVRRLTSNDAPVWSPDGRRIAYVFTSRRAPRLMEIRTMNRDGRRKRILLRTRWLRQPFVQYGQLAWAASS